MSDKEKQVGDETQEPIEVPGIDWEAFENRLRFFNREKLETFLSSYEGKETIAQAPDWILEKLRAKFEKYGVTEDGKPRVERFVCNAYPNLLILYKNTAISFYNGVFKTDDPEIVEAIVNNRYYKRYITADNPEIRKRMR